MKWKFGESSKSRNLEAKKLRNQEPSLPLHIPTPTLAPDRPLGDTRELGGPEWSGLFFYYGCVTLGRFSARFMVSLLTKTFVYYMGPGPFQLMATYHI